MFCRPQSRVAGPPRTHPRRALVPFKCSPDICTCLHAGVRRTCLTVLSHLILNDQMKVKGHVARVALRLLDDEPQLREWSHRFFTTLAQRSSGAKVSVSLSVVLLS